MPALTSAWTWAGNCAANWPSSNIVARRPFWRSALRMAGVWSFDGPSSNVSPTYPLHVAACDAVAVRVTAAALAPDIRATARPVTRMRLVPMKILLAWATRDGRPGVVAVVLDGDAPVVAAAVGLGDEGLGVGVAGVDVPGCDDFLGGGDVHGYGPGVGAGDGDVEVVAVAPRLAGRQRRGATAPAAAAATT